MFRHVVTNAAPTALAVMGLQLGYLLGGSILIETVFSWPGTGFLLNAAIFQRDLPLLQGIDPGARRVLRHAEPPRRRGADRARSAHQAGLTRMAVVTDIGLDVPPVPVQPDRARLLGRASAAGCCAIPSAVVAAVRHPRHRALRGLRAVDRACRSLPRLDAAPPAADRRRALSARLRRARPRHAEPPHLWRPAVAADGLAAGGLRILAPVRRSGIFAGFIGGRVNTLIMRTVDVFYAFPSVLLAIALSGALGAGIVNAIASLTVVFTPQVTRIAEAVTTQIRTRDFVEAARTSGAGSLAIIRVHVLGNVLGPIFVYATSLISVSMILASGLSFLGLGTKPPEPEWGLMLNTLRTAIYVQPVVAALPGVMIFITSISFNLLSDGLRSAMEVK